MELSRFNILTPVRDQDGYLLVNLLSGQADLLDGDDGRRLASGEIVHRDDLVAKGYLVDPADEERRYRAAYLDFVAARDDDEVQLFYAPTYACNFGCSYCFQDEYAPPPAAEQDAVLDAFFAYVADTFADRRKYVTLFGGEPLLPTPGARHVVERLVRGTAERGLDLAVVTNGYNLAGYVDLLATGRIREVQVTLDGTEKIHDTRRYLKGGKGTFGPIVAGIDACLAAGLRVNLRTVLDKDNIENYAELARFAVQKGWTDDPLFKTQIGRNYELHHCQSERAKLYSRLSLFDACPACKTEWAFDYTGRIYPCTANVGKEGEAVGTFHPARRLDADPVECWQERDVLAIEQCRTCSVQLACGGGCGAVAKNRDGSVTSPDCRPVRELLSLGAALYGPPATPA